VNLDDYSQESKKPKNSKKGENAENGQNGTFTKKALFRIKAPG